MFSLFICVTQDGWMEIFEAFQVIVFIFKNMKNIDLQPFERVKVFMLLKLDFIASILNQGREKSTRRHFFCPNFNHTILFL